MKSHTDQFFDDARNGGWTGIALDVNDMLLQPEAWQGAYRTRLETKDEKTIKDVARAQFRNFGDFVFDGKDVDEALASIA